MNAQSDPMQDQNEGEKQNSTALWRWVAIFCILAALAFTVADPVLAVKNEGLGHNALAIADEAVQIGHAANETAQQAYKSLLSVNGTVETVNGTTVELNAQIYNLSLTIQSLQSDLTGLQWNVSDLQSEVSGLKSDISGLHAALTNLTNVVAVLQSRTTSAKSSSFRMSDYLESPQLWIIGGILVVILA